MKVVARVAAVTCALFAAAPSWATITTLPVPEPGILELLGAGAIAGVVIWARNRRR